MDEEGIERLRSPPDPVYRTDSPIHPYGNIIYKMQRDGYRDDEIFDYVTSKGCKAKPNTLWRVIQFMEENNFPERVRMNPLSIMEGRYPEGTVTISKESMLKYIFTQDEKKRAKLKDKEEKEEKEKTVKAYPSLDRARKIFQEFHAAIMGKDLEKLDQFLAAHQEGELKEFCANIKKDIAPVKNAISFRESSDFVEGNNNNFKLIKRIL